MSRTSAIYLDSRQKPRLSQGDDLAEGDFSAIEG
jgi:hypothetical protein